MNVCTMRYVVVFLIFLGWTGDGRSCTDMDECAVGTHQCGAHAQCANADGSYTCTCDDGYENIETDGGTICIGNTQIRIL